MESGRTNAKIALHDIPLQRTSSREGNFCSVDSFPQLETGRIRSNFSPCPMKTGI